MDSSQHMFLAYLGSTLTPSISLGGFTLRFLRAKRNPHGTPARRPAALTSRHPIESLEPIPRIGRREESTGHQWFSPPKRSFRWNFPKKNKNTILGLYLNSPSAPSFLLRFRKKKRRCCLWCRLPEMVGLLGIPLPTAEAPSVRDPHARYTDKSEVCFLSKTPQKKYKELMNLEFTLASCADRFCPSEPQLS